MLWQRLATAAVGIPLVVGAIWVGGGLLAGVVAVALAVAVLELAAARGALKQPSMLLAALLTAVVPLAALAGDDYVLGALAGGVVLLSTLFVLTPEPPKSLESWLWGVVGLLYFGALAAHFVLLRRVPDGRSWLVFTVVAVWVIDTGAYFVGRPLGRHKMIPSISPGKTWEGAVGSLVAGFAVVFILDRALDLGLALEHRVALGLLLPPVVTFGDLAESALKRALGIKDSSGLVPGHGGIADRLDSLLFAAPAVYYYLKWIVS